MDRLAMDGILIVDKAQGMTSHDVVDLIRRRFRIKKAGHAGTLDPIATGVLVLLLGKYTKLSSQFMSEDKEYEGSLVLGASSDTGDAWGKITASGAAANISEEKIRDAFAQYAGEIDQKPPMYSSVKINGKKLYELARKGLSVDVAARRIRIDSIEVLRIEALNVYFRITCSKGTYVRQLCADIGETLGCGAYMSSLIRTRSGKFCIGDAVSIDKIRAMDIDTFAKTLRAE